MGVAKKAPFAEFIKDLNASYLKMREQVKAPEGIAVKYPCELCEATGHLMMKVQFAKLSTPSALFERANGGAIVGYSMCPCPKCHGTGLDGDALMAGAGDGATVGDVLAGLG